MLCEQIYVYLLHMFHSNGHRRIILLFKTYRLLLLALKFRRFARMVVDGAIC